MSLLALQSVDEIRSRGSIKDSDVLRLRRALHEDAGLSPAEADALFDLNASCAVKDAAWASFFVEAITDYIVNQAAPEGYMVAAKANWLVERIAVDGVVRGRTEFELLINVLEKARWSPLSLMRFALEQIREAVRTGSGPLRPSQALELGAICVDDVQLLRRLLLAFGGDSIAVTRAEADVLIDINKAIRPGKGCPEFTPLFVHAVANAVLHGLGLAAPSRAEALQTDDNSDKHDPHPLVIDAFAGAAARARSAGRAGVTSGRGAEAWSTCRVLSSEEQALAKLERQRVEIITNEKIEEADATWLAHRLASGARLNENEVALIAHLHCACPLLPPVLRDLAEGDLARASRTGCRSAC